MLCILATQKCMTKYSYHFTFRFIDPFDVALFDYETAQEYDKREIKCENCQGKSLLRYFLNGKCPQCKDHFPLLNVKSLSRRNQLLFKERLKRDVVEIDQKFNFLCNRTIYWLIDIKKSAQDLSRCIQMCSIDQQLIEQVRNSEEEDGDKGIKVAFDVLKNSNYFSFFHYKLLEVIVTTLAGSSDVEIKELLEDYIMSLKCFIQRKIFHVPISTFMNTDFSKDLCLVVKMHTHDQQYLPDTLEALASLQTDIANILEMNAIDLPLAGVLMGCLEIIFYVPQECLEPRVLFPLKTQQKEALYNLGIERICLGQQCCLLTPIIDQFILLEMRTVQYLQHINCDVTLLQVLIMDVNQMKSNVPIHVTNELECATSVENIFSILSTKNMISFFHYQLLKHIISSLCYGSKLLRKSLKEYETTFKNEFVWDKSSNTHQVYQVPNAMNLEDAVELSIITDGSWDEDVTFDKIYKLEDIVTKIMWVPPYALSLESIKPEPLTLLYTIPMSDVSKILPLTGEQWKYFRCNGIAKLHCSEFTYQDGG